MNNAKFRKLFARAVSVLALSAVIFSLFACGNKDANTTTDAANESITIQTADKDAESKAAEAQSSFEAAMSGFDDFELPEIPLE